MAARAGLHRRIKNGRINLLAFGPLARSSAPMCPNRLLDLRHYLHDNSERDSITTLFRRVSDVGLGYTPPRLATTDIYGSFIPNDFEEERV